MTSTAHWMEFYEKRDYSELKEDLELLHLIKMRDRLAYYSLQLRPFFYQEPWDLPVVVDGRRYPPQELHRLQMGKMSVVDFYALLTDIEAALIEAAARRGITLRNRGKVDEEGSPAPSPQRQRGVNGRALGE